MSSRFKLCTFDVTNTLLKFQGTVGEQYAKVGCLYGVKRDPEQLSNAFFHHWKAMNSTYPNYGVHCGMTSQLWWKEMINRVFSQEEGNLSQDQLNSISNHLYDAYKTKKCWKVSPGAKSLLLRLKERKITLGVISNFDERLDSVLSSTDLKCHFDFILASYVIKTAKPSKGIFDLALQKACMALPSEAVHIGDNVSLDYIAAKKAGWDALLLNTERLPEESLKLVNPKHIVQDISEIEKVIVESDFPDDAK